MNDVILWLDLETTGVDETADPIIEVGAILTDKSPAFNVVSEFERIVKPDNKYEALDRMDIDVIDMHVANGLVKSLLLGEGLPIGVIDDNLCIWLNNVTQHAGKRIPLAGSGVSHFDRRFIKAQLPRLDKKLTYWAYDIGAVRRFLRLYGLIGDSTPMHEAKTHRALDDVRAHIEEAREYGRLIERVPA